MVAEFYIKKYTLQNLREKSFITRAGVSMLGISDAAEAIGFRTMRIKVTLEKLAEEHPVPFIAHWKQNHFVVVYKIKKTISRPTEGFTIEGFAQSETLNKS
jgi:ATP-binding cassette subfamily B protein